MIIEKVKDLGSVYLVNESMNVPKSAGNSHYQLVLKWLENNALTIDTLKEKKEKLLELNNQKKIEAREAGIEIIVDGIAYLANKKTVEEFALLRGLNGGEVIYWRDKDGKPHELQEEQQKNLGHSMKNIALGIEKIYMKTEIAINALTKSNIDKFDLDAEWSNSLNELSK